MLTNLLRIVTMSYKPYSKRKTPVFTDTTASDLFDDLLSGKPLKNQAANQSSLTKTNAKQRLNVRGSGVPHPPEECSPPKVFRGGTQETKVDKGVSSWSRRKYEYSFSPRCVWFSKLFFLVSYCP